MWTGFFRASLKDLILAPLYYKGYLKKGRFAVLWHHYRGLLDGLRNQAGKAHHIFA
jgi:hypothetical protein